MPKVRMYHAASNRYQEDAAENFAVFHQADGWVVVDEEVDAVDAVAAPVEPTAEPVADDAPAEPPKRVRAK